MENECIMVSSKGLRKSCVDYELCDLSKLNPNELLYVASGVVYEFSQRIHEIKVPFILVTGDNDHTIPFDVFPTEEMYKQFIEHKHLKKWFVQNGVYVHEKMVQMPIGMDYHTFNQTTPLEQENSILGIEKVDTELKIYSNCHFSMKTRFGADRLDAIQSVPKELLILETNYVPRFESWKNQSKYRFCLSPHGNGLDCHRTWEALIMGTIPIVKTSPLDSLYEHLPVLIVKEWNEVTDSLLRETVDHFQQKTFQLEKLTLMYWIKKMKKSLLEKMKKSLYVVGHTGLGDHLFMMGGIRFLTQFYDTIHVFCNKQQYKQIQSIYHDSQIVFIPHTFSNLEEEKQMLTIKLSQMNDDVLVCGLWKSFFKTKITNTKFLNYVPPKSSYSMDLCSISNKKYHFIEDFYKDMNLTLSHFYEGFKIDSTPESIALYERVKDYYIVFIQQKNSDGYTISIDKILEKYLWKENTLLVCNDENLYEGIVGLETKFDLVKPFVKNDIIFYKELIQNCHEIYMIDSCFLGMIIPYHKMKQMKASIIDITIA